MENKQKQYLMVKSYPLIESVHLAIVNEEDLYKKYSDIPNSKFYEIESVEKMLEGLKKVSVKIELTIE